MSEYEQPSGSSSKFNAGIALIQRIDKHLIELGEYRSNPLAWNIIQMD